ncbi:hypothetical protein VKT23_007808 [Stygiomarasmius scandens]|uniref:F-box domain-containing protein n=1 Tax=Marasmiellus scandens TaxID=2682957 RepID=A0ABR1JMP7_9AGAR
MSKVSPTYPGPNLENTPPPTSLSPHTQILDQLRAGYVPSALEAMELKVLSGDVQKDLTVFEEKMMQLTTALRDVGMRYDSRVRYRDLHLGLLAPIRKLPFELLVTVFSLCCTSLENPGLSVVTNQHAHIGSPGIVSATTLALSQTCVLWRHVTLSHPPLWACLRVDLTWRPFKVQILVDLYLRRSASSPMTLHLEAYQGLIHDAMGLESPYCLELGNESLDLFDSILRTANRWAWASFDFCLDLQYQLATFAEYWEVANMENLQRLEVRHEPASAHFPFGVIRRNLRPPMSNSFLDRFEGAPSLVSISLPRLIPMYLASFPQLSSVDVVECHTLAEIRGTLSLCPRLKVLEVSNEYGLDLYGVEDVEEISSSSVESLTLKFGAVCGFGILSLLNLPRLVNLDIEAAGLQLDDEWRAKVSEGLPVLLSRCSSLYTLRLDAHLLSEAGLPSTLSQVPALQRFWVVFGTEQDTTDFMDKLVLSAYNFAPKLNLLCIRIPNFLVPLDFSLHYSSLAYLQKMTSMLESRSASLTKFVFSAPLDASSNEQWMENYRLVEPRISALRSMGMRIQLDVYSV